MKYAKGPWRHVRQDVNENGHILDCIYDAKQERVCYAETHAAGARGYSEKTKANARLIASAPEMLQLLDQIEPILGGRVYDPNKNHAAGLHSLIVNLIKKAKGEK